MTRHAETLVSDLLSPPPRPGVLVLERNQRRWEAALKRQLASRLFVRPCKLLADVREQFQQRPGSVVVVDLLAGGDVAAVFSHLAECRRTAGVIAIAPPLGFEDETALRELGVTSLLPDIVREELLAAQCLRLLGQCNSLAPRDNPK